MGLFTCGRPLGPRNPGATNFDPTFPEELCNVRLPEMSVLVAGALEGCSGISRDWRNMFGAKKTNATTTTATLTEIPAMMFIPLEADRDYIVATRKC